MPVGPSPISSTPLTYKNKGITVIGPANSKYRLKPGLSKPKSFKSLFALEVEIEGRKKVYKDEFQLAKTSKGIKVLIYLESIIYFYVFI